VAIDHHGHSDAMRYKAYAALVNGDEKQVSGPRALSGTALAERNRPPVGDGRDREARGPRGRAVMQGPLLRGTQRPSLAGRVERGASVGGASGANQTELVHQPCRRERQRK
jgi:hypothetical protein